MYKSIIYALVFTGVKAKKVKGLRDSNMYSLKYLLPSWQKIEEHEDPQLSIKAMLVMWVVAVTGRYGSDGMMISSLVLLCFAASMFWEKTGEGKADPQSQQDAAHNAARAHIVKLPSVRASLAILVLVLFACRMVLKWYDYAVLLTMGLAALRSFSDHETHTSVKDMLSSVAQGLYTASKEKWHSMAQAIVEEVKAPPTPRDAPPEKMSGPAGQNKGGKEQPPRETTTMPPPQSSIQQPKGSGKVRRRDYMDSKLGSTNKKAVKEDMKTALARKAAYL